MENDLFIVMDSQWIHMNISACIVTCKTRYVARSYFYIACFEELSNFTNLVDMC